MDPYVYFGIDPGTTGALVRFRGEQTHIMRFYKSVKDGKKTKTIGLTPLELKRDLCISFDIHTDLIPILSHELVNSWKFDNPYSIGTFMRVTGVVEGVVLMHDIEINYVTSSKWQLEFGLGGIEDRAARLRAAVQVIWDLYKVKVTQNEAAAYLLARYTQRKHRGILTHGQDTSRILRPATGIIRRTSVLD